MTASSLTRLLAVLRERRIPLARDDVQWAFESTESQDNAVAWVDHYLQPDTLLGKEELDLYQSLLARNKGVEDWKDVSGIQPFADEDVRRAIDALEASTAEINQQTNAIEARMNVVLELQTQSLGPSKAAQRQVDAGRKRNASEKGQLDFDMEGLSDAITDRVSSAQKHTNFAASTLTTTTTDFLDSDDRMLSEISGLDPSCLLQIDLQNIDKWCSSLASFRAAAIQERVDRIFREALSADEESGVAQRPEEDALLEKKTLKDELETLHVDIKAVAEMAVEQELRKPIHQTLEQAQAEEVCLRRRTFDYIIAALKHMTTRLQHLDTHAADLHAHTTAVIEVCEFFTQAFPTPVGPAPSPHKRAVSMVVAPTPIQFSAATRQIFSHLDVSVSTATAVAPCQALAHEASTRRLRLLERLDSSRDGAVHGVDDALSSSAVAVQEMSTALYANSSYGTVEVTKADVKEGLESLERGIDQVNSSMAKMQQNLDATGREKEASGVGRALMERWGNVNA